MPKGNLRRKNRPAASCTIHFFILLYLNARNMFCVLVVCTIATGTHSLTSGDVWIQFVVSHDNTFNNLAVMPYCTTLVYPHPFLSLSLARSQTQKHTSLFRCVTLSSENCGISHCRSSGIAANSTWYLRRWLLPVFSFHIDNVLNMCPMTIQFTLPQNRYRTAHQPPRVCSVRILFLPHVTLNGTLSKAIHDYRRVHN